MLPGRSPSGCDVPATLASSPSRWLTSTQHHQSQRQQHANMSNNDLAIARSGSVTAVSDKAIDPHLQALAVAPATFPERESEEQRFFLGSTS